MKLNRSLFLTLFFWFCSALLVVMLLAIYTHSWLKHDFHRPATQQEIQHLITLIEHERPVIAEGRKLWSQIQSGWNLIAVPATSYSQLPRELEDFVELSSQQNLIIFGQQGGWLILGPVVRHDVLYLAASRTQWYNLIETEDRWHIFLITLLVIVLLCLLLVWRLTQPIRQLRKVVRQLGQGNFDTQELRKIQRRRDETSQLAAEMVEMASSIQRLLHSHKQLLHDVSHELRSPLTRLQIALAIARKKDAEHQLDSEHNRIERAVEQVNKLISEILDIARLQENNKKIMKLQRLPLKRQLLSWIEDAELEFAEKQLSVRWGLPNYVVSLNCDWLLLQRAFDNLLRNAIRYSPQGGEIKVGVEVEFRGRHNWVKIWVQDQGPGVPEDKLEEIFNAFSQVDSARDHAAGGYGLGLALVKRIVELHGGKVEAQNQEQGLRIAMIFPLGNDK